MNAEPWAQPPEDQVALNERDRVSIYLVRIVAISDWSTITCLALDLSERLPSEPPSYSVLALFHKKNNLPSVYIDLPRY